MDTWRRKVPRGQLNFQRRAMNCESSRNLPTGKCEVISGKSVGCGRPESRKGNSSPGVMNPGTSEPSWTRELFRMFLTLWFLVKTQRKKIVLAWGRSVEERGERGTKRDQKKKIFLFHHVRHVWWIDLTTARAPHVRHPWSLQHT